MLDSTFCTSMISSIESTLLPLGYSVIVCECHNNAEMKLRKTQYLIDRIVDGIVLIPYASDGKQIEMIQKSNIPLILLDQEIKDHATDCIVLDNELAGFESKLATTSSTGGLSLALQMAIVTARPKGRYRKHFYWPAIKRYYWNLLFPIPLLAHLYISELLHLLYCRLFQHNIL